MSNRAKISNNGPQSPIILGDQGVNSVGDEDSFILVSSNE